MSTTVLAYLILFMGFITFLAGAFGALMLLFEEVAKTGRLPFGLLRDDGEHAGLCDLAHRVREPM